MSNFLAVATVTATLRDVLDKAAKDGATAAAMATHLSPGNSSTGLPMSGVNIYLYEVTPNVGLRNSDLPTRTRDGSVMQRPRIALDLHYLLSFYGDEQSLEPQRILGSVARTLHAQPLLTRKNIQDAVASLPDLSKSDLADELELVKFTPMSLSLEELSRLWSVFLQTSYRLSMVYTASVVLIEKEETPRTVLPVEKRTISVMPSLEGAAQPPISPDELLDLQLWLKSDTGVTYDSNGVELWADQSGNDNNAKQSDVLEVDIRPAFVAHGLGGKPVLRFDGDDDYLAIQNLNYAGSGAISEITVCALVRSDSEEMPKPQIIASFDSAKFWQLALRDDGKIGWDTNDSTGGPHELESTDSYTDGNWHLVCGWFNHLATPDKQIFVDGEQVASATAHGGNELGSIDTRFGFIGVGSEADAEDGDIKTPPSFYLRGDVAEILIYNRALTIVERQQLERYFVDRYRS